MKKILNRETLSYVVVGILTTAVDYIVFALVNESLKDAGFGISAAVTAAGVISWAAAVIFAYLANKLIVFRNYCMRPAHILRESAMFFSARIVSGVISVFLVWLLAAVMGMNEYIAKILSSVVSLIFNYIASKLWIFRK